ncbi:MAG: hypothetical protein FD130_2174 [Halothiobacillaceae bacterium]|nr:MAG: hypothetical protein FD130_2174 [Halothiobacillaceae bacterium]
MTAAALSASLEVAINHYLHLDPELRTKLLPLQGKLIALELRHLNSELFLLVGSDAVFVLPHCERNADTRLIGTPLALARLGLGGVGSRRSSALFASGVEIQGDLEVGRQMSELLNGLDIDWEEQLSKYIGDVAAHQVGNVARSLMQWGQQTAERMARNSVEYLQEESRDLPHPIEVGELLDAVDGLRSDVDRLEARLQRLEKNLALRATTPHSERVDNHER